MRTLHTISLFAAGMLAIPAVSEAAIYTLPISSWGQMNKFTVGEYVPVNNNSTAAFVGGGYMGVLEFDLSSVTLAENEVVTNAVLSYTHPYAYRTIAAPLEITGGRLTIDALGTLLTDTPNRRALMGYTGDGSDFASFNPVYLTATSAADVTAPQPSVSYGSNGWYGFQYLNVTDAVASWLEDGAANYGLGLKSNNSTLFALARNDSSRALPSITVTTEIVDIPEPASLGLIAGAALLTLGRRRTS